MSSATRRILYLLGWAVVCGCMFVQPARAMVVYPFVTDSDSGISTGRLYTHLLDFPSNGNPATVNGVAFTSAGLSGSNWNLSIPSTGTFGGSGSGSGMALLFSDFYYSGNTGTAFETLTLSGLTPGMWYEARLYAHAFGVSNRLQNITFTNGTAVDTLPNYNEDGYITAGNPDGRNFISEVYQAQGGSVVFSIQGLNNNESYHEYGLSNEAIPEPATLSLLGLGVLALARRRKRA